MQDEVWMSLAGRTAVVTGAASGIGAAVTRALLRAEARVHALDIVEFPAEGSHAIHCDLGDRASIDLALETVPDRVDMVFNCAGVPNGGRFSPDRVMAINWLGLRHLSEALLPRIPSGGSITHVASTAGRRWAENLDAHRALLEAPDFEAGARWVADHPEVIGDGYAFSKETVQYYTLRRSLETIAERNVRMNSVCPGVTNTPIAGDFRKGVGSGVIDRAIEVAGRIAEPHEMAGPLLFLADARTGSYVNGVNLNVDRGTGAAHLLGQW